MKPKPEKMWAISLQWDDGRSFLYCGTSLTRKDAIYRHSTEKGRTWKECRKNGDRAIKVLVKPL